MAELVFSPPEPRRRRTRYQYEAFNDGGIYVLRYRSDFAALTSAACAAIYSEARRLNVCVNIQRVGDAAKSPPGYEPIAVQFLWDLPYRAADNPGFRRLHEGDGGPYLWGPHIRTQRDQPPELDLSGDIAAYLVDS